MDYEPSCCPICGTTTCKMESGSACAIALIEDPTECEVCGESFTGNPHEEIGEFVDGEGKHLIAHAQCGLDHEYELA